MTKQEFMAFSLRNPIYFVIFANKLKTYIWKLII